MNRTTLAAPLALVLSLVACGDPPAPAATTDKGGDKGGKVEGTAKPADAKTAEAKKKAEPKDEAPSGAAIGSAAPDFTLKDVDGKEVSLASFKGKTVVLEWFNPECPFVKNAHGEKGSLKDFAKKATAKGDVVWLAINSGAEGKQGAGADNSKAGAKTFGLEHPVLLDPDGKVGKAYGATNTPHMFVVDPKGTLVYAGAIDNSPDGEGESPEGGKLVNHVEAALADVAAGKPVAVSKTKAYGCSVKYGS